MKKFSEEVAKTYVFIELLESQIHLDSGIPDSPASGVPVNV